MLVRRTAANFGYCLLLYFFVSLFFLFPHETNAQSISGPIIPSVTTVTDQPVRSPAIGILPDNPFYVFKNIGRGLQSAFTFSDAKKALLYNKFANEKILEVSAFASIGKIDKATDHLASYSKDVAKVGEIVNKLAKKDPANAEGIISQALSDQIKNQGIIDKLEEQTSD